METIKNIQNVINENTNVIIRQVSSNTKIKDRVTKANINEYNTNVIHDIGVDWGYMDMWRDADNEGDPMRQRINFDITFERFDERLIPYISTHIIYKQSGSDVATSMIGDQPLFYNPNDNFTGTRQADYTWITSAKFCEIEDIKHSELKKVRLVCCLRFSNGFAILPQFSAKLLLSIYNPCDYKRVN